jgi:hypothetical protein
MLIPVSVSVPIRLQEYLLSHGYEPHPSKQGFALVDTGASISAVDDRVMLALDIPPVNQMETQTPHGLGFSNLYNASASLPEIGLPAVALDRCLGSYLGEPFEDGTEIIMLIGRDILRRCVLTYDGPNGQATLRVGSEP